MVKHLVITWIAYMLVISVFTPCGAISSADKIADIDQEIKTLEKNLKATNQEDAAQDECKLPPGNFYSCKGDTDSVKGTAVEGTLCSFTTDKLQDGTVKICLNGYWFIHAEKEESLHKRVKKSHTLTRRRRSGWRRRRRSRSYKPNHAPSFYGKGRCSPSQTRFSTSSGQTSTRTYFDIPRAWDVEDGYINTLKDTSRYKRGALLQGSTSGSGKAYRFSYIATDSDRACTTCSFNIYVKIQSCSTPRSPSHGSVSCPRGTYEGSTCYYYCGSGYRVSRSSTYCRNGRWSSTNVYCSAISCGSNLPSVTNGRYACSRYTYGTTCYATCNTGYRRSSSCYINCRSSGSWYESCRTGVICKDSDPPVLTNCPASIEKLADTGLTSAVVTWSDPVATDTQDTTDPVPVQTSGSIKSGDRVYTGLINTIRYFAYDKASNPSNECKFTVKVTVEPCSSLSAPLHGIFTCTNSYFYDSTCTYTCNSGFTSTDTMVTRCDVHGSWSTSTTPSCSKIQCPSPNTISSLSFQYGNYTCPTVIEYKDVCQTTCDSGFKLSNLATVECGVDSNNEYKYIQHGTPVCIDITPPVFDSCAEGTIKLPFTADKGTTSATVTYTPPTATDNVDDPPAVNKISGPSSGDILTSGVHNVVFKATDTAGNPSNVCIYGLNVTTIECDVIPPPTGGDVICDKDEIYGSVCTLTCHVGYELSDSSTTECLQNWSWSGTVTCNKKYCSGPPAPADNGIFNCTDVNPVAPLYPYNTLCQLACNVGFAADHETFIRCDDNKLWDGIDAAECKDITPPVLIGCLSTLNFTADSRLRSTTITWTAPTATDNADPSPQVTQLVGPKIGDTLEGSAFVKYQAKDDSGNPSNVCVMALHVYVLECGVSQWPDNGAYTCDLGSIYGSICTYTCDTGHEFVTTPSLLTVDVECKVDQTWSYGLTPPTCTAKVCGPPETRGNYGEFKCPDTEYSYPAKCTLVCLAGFATDVINTAECVDTGVWIYNGDEPCKDVTPPVIVNCKTYQTFYLDRSSNTTTVNWTVPSATDNADNATDITIEKIFGSIQQGTVLTMDEYTVGYRAIDTAGNPSTHNCSITLNIDELFCLAPSTNFTDDELLFVCQSYKYGHSCAIGCMNGKSLTTTSTSSIVCEANFTSTPPTMYWDTLNKDSPECEDPNACPRTLNVPDNGAIVYEPAVGDPELALITCNENYDVPYDSQTQAFCLDTGDWHPNTLPDCSSKHHPGRIVLPVEYRYSGDCSSPETIEAIKSTTLARIYAFFSGIETASSAPACVADSSCTVDDLQVVCGTSGKKKKKSVSGNIVIKFKLAKTGEIQTIDDYFTDEAELLAISVLFKTRFDEGFFDIIGLILELDSFVADEYALTVCTEPGTILVQGIDCKPCGKGMYLSTDGDTDTCEDCPLGTYSNNDTTLACTACPVGQSTRTTGSKSSDMCLAQCSAGTTSTSGVVPCTPCAIDTYQPNTGMTYCDACAAQLTSFKSGASTCAAYDLQLDSGEYNFPLLQLDGEMSTFSITFWARMIAGTTIKLISTTGQEAIATVTFSSNTDGVATIFLTEEYEDRWTRISVIINIGYVSVYIDGKLADQTVSVSATSLISGSTLQLNLYSSTDIGITGIGVYAHVIDVSDASSSTHCMVNQTATLTTTDSILALNMPVIRAEPSTCKGSGVCAGQPCGTHTCTQTDTGYKCTCHDGYTGDNCEHEPCYNNGCLNGATCIAATNGYTCTCSSGYSGQFCENTPLNGGWSLWDEYTTCTQTCDGGTQQRSRSCTSPAPGPYGATCDGSDVEVVDCNTATCSSLNPCNSNPCDSHRCVELTGGYECKCNSGYTGRQCEIVPDNCDKHACQNSATCSSVDSGGYSCSCTTGYQGALCQTVIDLRSYWSKWTSCSATCNGGTMTRTRICASTINSACVADTQTAQCNTETCLEDSCTSSPCGTLHTCVNTETSFTCICTTGYSGSTCEQSIDNCANNPCNNGNCTSQVDGFVCDCKDGYSGELCDIAPVDGGWNFWPEWSDCSPECGVGSRQRSRPCDNPAPEAGGHECVGDNNQTESCSNNCGEYCAALPCGEDHLCVSNEEGYTCHCKYGYTGVNCHILPPDPCNSNPCSNGGICSVEVDTFKCACVGGYSGDTCDDEPEPSEFDPWADWSDCSKSCGGGVQRRERTCENNTKGDPCTGSDAETVTCELQNCPECSSLKEPFGLNISCNTTGDAHVCHMACLQGYSLANGTTEFDVWSCGPETGFEWDQERDIPSCNKATSPKTVTSVHTTSVEPEVACDEKTQVEDSYKTALSTTPCSTDADCETEVTVVGCTNRRKRQTSDTSSLTITYTLTNTDTTLTSEELLAEKGGMMNASESVLSDSAAMTIVIGGTTYTADVAVVDPDVETVCPLGTIGDGGDSCVACVPGTKYEELTNVCKYCPKGYYQELSGQFTCTQCPVGYSTESAGSWNSADCSLTCASGTYMNTELTDCVDCPIGTYQELDSQVMCLNCADGYTTHEIASNKSSDCVLVLVSYTTPVGIIAGCIAGGLILCVIVGLMLYKIRSRKAVVLEQESVNSTEANVPRYVPMAAMPPNSRWDNKRPVSVGSIVIPLTREPLPEKNGQPLSFVDL